MPSMPFQPFNTSVTIILGTGSIGDPSLDPQVRFRSPEAVRELLDTFYARGGRYLDTARGYSPGAPGTCESVLGSVGIDGRFEVDTKLEVGRHGREDVRRQVEGTGKVKSKEGQKEGSLEKLGVEKISTLYLHAPFPRTSPSETLSAITSLHTSNKISRFGLSNHTPAQVSEFVDVAKRDGLMRPTVCQENYSIVMRTNVEERLLPVLRREGIALRAYSPAAGGFLTSPEYQARPNSRFDKDTPLGPPSLSLYSSPHLLSLSIQLRSLAAKHNMTGHALALRWIVHHSALRGDLGDGIVLGVSSVGQLNEDLDAVEMGRLDEGVVAEVEGLWRGRKGERDGRL
ncbi:MAG: hypothetical protein Q9160_000266 [Pyrenula sp. 1 TL-2023]